MHQETCESWEIVKLVLYAASAQFPCDSAFMKADSHSLS